MKKLLRGGKNCNMVSVLKLKKTQFNVRLIMIFIKKYCSYKEYGIKCQDFVLCVCYPEWLLGLCTVLVAAKISAAVVDDDGTYYQHNCYSLLVLCVVVDAAVAVVHCCGPEHHHCSCTAHSLATWSPELDNDAETTIVVFDYGHHHYCCCSLPQLPQFELRCLLNRVRACVCRCI